MDNPLLLLLIGIAGAAFAILATRLGKALAARDRPLKPYFRRLGRISPAHPCPCNRPTGSYQHCCRPRDLATLEHDVRSFLFKDWMRKSGGRARACSMRTRLEDFPMPELILPDWVVNPSNYVFPIEESRLRAWTPLPSSLGTLDEAGPTDDVPI